MPKRDLTFEQFSCCKKRLPFLGCPGVFSAALGDQVIKRRSEHLSRIFKTLARGRKAVIVSQAFRVTIEKPLSHDSTCEITVLTIPRATILTKV